MIMWLFNCPRRPDVTSSGRKLPGMNDPTPDDRELARRVLEADAKVALEELLGRYFPRLQGRAAGQLNRNPSLARHGDADDLVQRFLYDKLLPAQKQRVMLRPVADGSRELWLRLCASFDNFIRSLLRGKGLPMSKQRVGEGKEELNPEDRSVEVWPDITEQLAAQLAAIRKLPQTGQSIIPYGVILLLSERLVLAKQVADSYAPEDGRTIGNQSVREVVEALAQWLPEEETISLPPSGVALKSAWEQICHNTAERPQLGGALEVAAVLGCSKDVWLQWVTRGRVKLVEQLGETEARRCFRYWPDGPFERAAAAKEGEP
jgi:hypothetical protein